MGRPPKEQGSRKEVIKSSEIMQIPNPPKGKLIGFLITIEWIEEGKRKPIIKDKTKRKIKISGIK